MCAFDGTGCLLGKILSVASIALCEVQQSLNRLLICCRSVTCLHMNNRQLTVLVALNLDNHLLQTVDGLLTTLFWELVLKVTLGLTGGMTSSVFGLLWHILGGTILQVLHSRSSTRLSVNARVSAVPLVTCRRIGSVARITRATRCLARVTNSIPHLRAREWLLLVNLASHLILQIISGGNVMPGVVIGGAINL